MRPNAYRVHGMMQSYFTRKMTGYLDYKGIPWLFRRFPGVSSLAKARESQVLAAWSGLGYYRRARNLRAAARLIARRHKGRFPADPQAARALPGVGRYTAGAVLSIAYGQKEPVLDGNVARVLSRIALVRQGTRTAAGRRELWALAQTLAEAAAAPGDLNQALMELGATLCTPLDPGCPRCPVRNVCAARAAGIEDSIPPRRTVRAPVTLRTAVALVSRSGRLLMRRRAGTGKAAPAADRDSAPSGRWRPSGTPSPTGGSGSRCTGRASSPSP